MSIKMKAIISPGLPVFWISASKMARVQSERIRPLKYACIVFFTFLLSIVIIRLTWGLESNLSKGTSMRLSTRNKVHIVNFHYLCKMKPKFSNEDWWKMYGLGREKFVPDLRVLACENQLSPCWKCYRISCWLLRSLDINIRTVAKQYQNKKAEQSQIPLKVIRHVFLRRQKRHSDENWPKNVKSHKLVTPVVIVWRKYHGIIFGVNSTLLPTL